MVSVQPSFSGWASGKSERGLRAAPHCADRQAATKNLRAVPSTATESQEASSLLAQVSRQIEDDAREQMIKNFNGAARDPFRCDHSPIGNYDIVSFDDGRTWWKGDGRCAAQLHKKRDEDAGLSSYWSTTVRVDTDMNSSWLPTKSAFVRHTRTRKGRFQQCGVPQRMKAQPTISRSIFGTG